MAAITIIETVLLVVALVYIVALLRSHADILRRLSLLEDGGVPAAGPAAAGPVAGAGPAGAVGMTPDPSGQPALPVSGTTLGGDGITLSLGAGSPVTLLAFLTSGCASCAPLWQGLGERSNRPALADRVVVVTHDTSRESPARVSRLAPSGAELVMSSAAWADYAVPASPHFVLTDGRGGILGRGSALSWGQLETMLQDARDDGAGSATARTTAERAARSEEMLARSGIGPGHPSLYPSAEAAPAGDRAST